jgi:hypothetical protein
LLQGKTKTTYPTNNVYQWMVLDLVPKARHPLYVKRHSGIEFIFVNPY